MTNRGWGLCAPRKCRLLALVCGRYRDRRQGNLIGLSWFGEASSAGMKACWIQRRASSPRAAAPLLRIPANADSHSDRLRTAIPIDRGQRSGDRGQLLLRSGRTRFVRRLPSYYGEVRLLMVVHHRLHRGKAVFVKETGRLRRPGRCFMNASRSSTRKPSPMRFVAITYEAPRSMSMSVNSSTCPWRSSGPIRGC
jgi:hypothetical protein